LHEIARESPNFVLWVHDAEGIEEKQDQIELSIARSILEDRNLFPGLNGHLLGQSRICAIDIATI
jgi:hypothetical protein